MRKRLSVTDDRRVARTLIFENPELGGEVGFHGRITVHVVGREVEPDRHPGMQRADEFATMGRRGISMKRLTHDGCGNPQSLARGERGHDILRIVKPAQTGIVIHIQPCLAIVLDDMPVGKPIRS